MSDLLKSAIERLRGGGFVIVTDDANRENEGDLIALAPGANEENLAFMIRHTSGVICAAITSADAKRLNLPPMTRVNQDSKGTAFTLSVDARAVSYTHLTLPTKA